MSYRMILTIPEARTLQRHLAELPREQRHDEWLSSYPDRLAIETPELLHSQYDDARLLVAQVMVSQHCSERHIAEQMNWRSAGHLVKAMIRLHKLGK